MRERGSERKREREKAEIWLPDVLFLFYFFVKTIPGPSEGGWREAMTKAVTRAWMTEKKKN